MPKPSEDAALDWLMDIASNETLPHQARMDARDKLRKCASRKIGETVSDVLKKDG